jgi:c-di-GMP-binding flagellar brake protein YcgR
MSTLTYDQKSEIRLAFDEAYVPAERRRNLRVKYQVEAQITEWRKGPHGLPFTVRIEDFSPTGVGMMHGAELALNSQYLLKVPRQQFGDLIVLMTVVRCEPREEGNYLLGLELSSVLDQATLEKFVQAINPNRVTSKRTKILLMLLGIVGLGTAILLT